MSNEISYWATQTGVLPINLLHCQGDNVEKYAMMDGDINNFCLDYSTDEIGDNRAYLTNAWSANMRSYIRVSGDDILLYCVDKAQPEIINKKLVLNNLEKFYQYISPKNNIPQVESIVPFIMKEFRGIRSSLREKNSGEDSMTALLYMLASIDGDVTEQNLHVLGLPSNTLGIISHFSIDESIENLKLGMDGFIPNVSLLLRHAAGQLFEEANYIAKFNPELDLFPSYDIKYAYDPQKLGAFYTPTYLARSIVDKVLKESDFENKKELIIFDPACGSGEFLVEALRQLKTKHFKGKVTVYAWDISKVAINMANFGLHFEKREWNDNLQLFVEEQDSLLAIWPKADIIIMNPPYCSWEQLNVDQREAVNNLLPKGRPNMSGVFYLMAVNALKEKGVLGCIMPTSFLINDATKELRSISKEKARPFYIGRLGNFVFQRAFVDVCVVMAKADETPNSMVTMLWTENKGDVVPDALRKLRMIDYGKDISLDMPSVSIYRKECKDVLNNEVWLPLSYKEAQMKKKLDELLSLGTMVRVKDIFDVKQGCRTGNNKLFKLTENEYKALPMNEQRYFKPSIDSYSLQNNVLLENSFVFFPYNENGETISTEDELAAEVPSFYAKLVKHKLLLEKRSGIKKWWLLTRPREWQYVPSPKIVSTEFGNSSNFSIDENAKFVVERGLAWLPKIKPISDEKMYWVLAILSSQFFNTLLAIYSRQLAGGMWFNLEKKFVDNIPLPRFEYLDEMMLKYLCEYGRKISLGLKYDFTDCENLVRSIYGQ